MRTIAIINQKGGVGKTTTTANLGAAFARAGKNVLLIDLDPQGHVSLHFGIEVAPDQATIYDVLTSGTPARDVLVSPRERISLIPADIDLAAAEAELISITGREVLLREAVAALDSAYDVVLIDCPPSLGVLTVNALAASTEVIIPLQAHFFGLQGLSKLLNTVTLVRQRINPALSISGICLCMHEASTKLAAEVAGDIAKFLEAARGSDKPWARAQLYKTAIRRNIKLAESSSFGQTVFDYAPKSNGAVDYASLAAEIMPGIDVAKLIESASGAEERPEEPSERPRAAVAGAPERAVVIAATTVAASPPVQPAPPTRPAPAPAARIAAAESAVQPAVAGADAFAIVKPMPASTSLDIRRPTIRRTIMPQNGAASAAPNGRTPTPRTATPNASAAIASAEPRMEQRPKLPPKRIPPIAPSSRSDQPQVVDRPAQIAQPVPVPATMHVEAVPTATAAVPTC